jgi:hypothetical protein
MSRERLYWRRARQASPHIRMDPNRPAWIRYCLLRRLTAARLTDPEATHLGAGREQPIERPLGLDDADFEDQDVIGTLQHREGAGGAQANSA